MLRAQPPKRAAVLLETVLACKWSLTVYQLIDAGTKRPGAMERSVEGLSAKVLNDCLRRNVTLGILAKESFPEIPPRVEYEFTPLGRRFRKILTAVADVQAELERDGQG
ncbi:MAG: helix-turn-helix transcriptional regulator [Opitutae bacterium]|nr:helix-turn-helix transcriptional regulator [Opitutae bacterium]